MSAASEVSPACSHLLTVSQGMSDRGFVGPVPVMTAAEARRLGWQLDARHHASRIKRRLGGPQLQKDAATRSAFWCSLASRPALLELVSEQLGPDILLWGASLVIIPPGHRHHWHVDVETADARPGSSVSVWVPLHGGGPTSALEALPGSHMFEASIQEMCAKAGKHHLELDDGDFEQHASEAGATVPAERLVARPGEAIVFDGRLWHASVNDSSSTRRALLLQYATPDTRILTPTPGSYQWPFEEADRRARCVLISGSDSSGVNDVIPPPGGTFGKRSQLGERIEQIEPLRADRIAAVRHRADILFEGPTATGLHIIGHVSMLAKGHTPHPPHTHQEEEVLVVLSGCLSIHLVDEAGAPARVERLPAGGVLYYALDQLHTITGESDEPAQYVILKWRSHRISRGSKTLHTRIVSRVDPIADDAQRAMRILFAGPTRYLRQLQCHQSSVPPGGGYDAHADAYDVAIVTLEGTIETLGKQVGPNSLIWYPMGSRHGLRNVGEHDAHYVVFEFHGANIGSLLNPYRLRTGARRIVTLPFRIVRRGYRELSARRT
jgi:quercetin dioxygenase-like cupin family protein